MDCVLIDENELSARTSIKATTLQKWRATGEGPPYVKLGRLCRYRWEDVEAWLKTRERTAIARKARSGP